MKETKKKKSLFLKAGVWRGFLLICLSGQAAVSQETPSRIVSASWDEVEALQSEARGKRAELLSPASYAAAQRAYARAQADSATGKSADRISRSLIEAREALKTAITNSELILFTFPELIKAYDDAAAQQASEFVPKTYAQAQSAFTSIISLMEDGDLAQARSKAPEAKDLLRQAELEAIQQEILGVSRDLLKQASIAGAENRAPISYQEAKEAIGEAEAFIAADRYNKSAARDRAQMASYLCRRAAFFTNWITTLRKEDANWEKLIRQFEAELASVGSTMHMDLEFDQDFDLPAQAILASIRSLQEDRTHLQEELAERDDQIGRLEAEMGKLRTESGKYVAELESKREELERRKQIENKIGDINGNFKPEEGMVLQQGEKIILRLTGLRFNSGSSAIRSENFPLLNKAQQAIREFPDWRIEIQGHTDSQGDEQENLELSQKRSEAVRTYLMQNMNLAEETISALGFGESQPVASNENSAGRAANRRIEIILTP
ncbi:MAG TPA: OmpA family protein [bacterium]|jgi:outer membrane protein OmpA-like peptidoglycan-associated protein